MSAEKTASRTSSRAKAQLPAARVRAPKLSVSLYQTDLERLESIKTFMRSKGFRKLSDSEALRLACRHAVVNDSLVALYQDMQQEDGRRKVAE